MNRRELLSWCVSGCVTGSVLLATRAGGAQDQPGRARVGPAPAQQRGSGQQSVPAQSGREQRPGPESIQVQMPKELEDLLIVWERESGKISKLRGRMTRYVYDSVYSVEKRSIGMFWYQAPDMGRMDFGPVKLPEPPINPEKLAVNGQPFAVQSEGNQRWICTGKEIFIINDDARLYDRVEIPPTQQGKNIVNGPLPFLFGMRAEQAKLRYHLALGEQHNPRANPPTIHVVAVPKLEVDAQEWSRAEVLLDGTTFVPKAMRLLNPQGTAETVYVFPAQYIKINELLPWLPNPFAERPPDDYTKAQDTRAKNDETPVLDRGNAPAAGARATRSRGG